MRKIIVYGYLETEGTDLKYEEITHQATSLFNLKCQSQN